MYKLCIIVYKCVHGAAPSYLAEMCIPVAASTGRRFLHSASHGDLMVYLGQERQCMDNVLLSLDLPPEMICHQLCVHRRRHLDSSRINWRQYYFVRPMKHDLSLSWLCVCVCQLHFHSLYDNSVKNTGAISSKFCVDTVETLGQQEFAFEFCGSTGVEISWVKSLVVGSELFKHCCCG